VAGSSSPPGLRRRADASSAGWSADGVAGAAGPCRPYSENTEQAEDPKSKIQSLKSSVKRSLNGYGREIFVESEDANGDKFRHERKGWAVVSERVAGDMELLE
jgi:hypothetical protein